MADNEDVARYRRWYRKLVRLFPKSHRDRFGESMEQTFSDLCRARAGEGHDLVRFVLWMFVEAFVGIIRENSRVMIMKHKNIVGIAFATACILFIPLLTKAPWSRFDFVVAGALVFGTGLTFELIGRKGGTLAYRAGVGVACMTGLLLVWMNLAVGLIGNENNPANLMYSGVIAVGFVGAYVTRLEPRGMSLTLAATAIAQALVPLIALAIWRPPFTSGVVQVLGVNALFVAMWAVSALLFRFAGRPSSANP